MIESLEHRTLLAVDLTAKGTLVVQGGTANDTIVVSLNPKNGVVSVNLNDALVSFAGKAVKRVLVAGDSGHDRVHIDPSLNRHCTVTGGSGADIIEGNYGSTLIGGSGNDKLYEQPFKLVVGRTINVGDLTGSGTLVLTSGGTSLGAASYLSGGDGNDTLVTSGGVDSTVDEASFIGGAGRDTLFANGGTITLSFEGEGSIDGLGSLSGIEIFSGNFASTVND